MIVIPDWIRLMPSGAKRHVTTAQAWLSAYVDEVNRRAEINMLKGGKLEGSHAAAMRQVSMEFNEWTKTVPP